MKEPRNSTFDIGQTVDITHSSTRYDKRRGLIVGKIGGGLYSVKLPSRTRRVNGPTGHPQLRTDAAETKNFKMHSLVLVEPVPALTETSRQTHLFS